MLRFFHDRCGPDTLTERIGCPEARMAVATGDATASVNGPGDRLETAAVDQVDAADLGENGAPRWNQRRGARV